RVTQHQPAFPTRRSSYLRCSSTADCAALTLPMDSFQFAIFTKACMHSNDIGTTWITTGQTDIGVFQWPKVAWILVVIQQKFNSRSEEHKSELQSPYDLVC